MLRGTAHVPILIGTVQQALPPIDLLVFYLRIMCTDAVRLPPPHPPANTEIKPQKPTDEPLSDAPESSTSTVQASTLLGKKFKHLLLSEVRTDPAKRFASHGLFLKQRLEAWKKIDRWEKSEEFTNRLEPIIEFIKKQTDKDCFFYLVHEALDICSEWPKRKSEHKHAVYLWFFFLSQEKTSAFDPQHRFPFALSLFQLQSALPAEVQEGNLLGWTDFLPDFDSAANQWQWIEQLKDAFSLHGESMENMSRYVSRLIRFAVKIGDNDKARLLKLVHDLLDICTSWESNKRKAKAISTIWRLDADKPQDTLRSATAGKSLEAFLHEQDHFPLALRILSLQPATPFSHPPEIWSRIGTFDIPHFKSDEIPWQWMEPAKDALCQYGDKIQKDAMSNALRFLLDAAKKSDQARTPALAYDLLKACENWEPERKIAVHMQLLENLPLLFTDQKDRAPFALALFQDRHGLPDNFHGARLLELARQIHCFSPSDIPQWFKTAREELEEYEGRMADPVKSAIIKQLIFLTEHIDADLRPAHIFDMIQLSQKVQGKQSRNELLEHVKTHNKNYLSQKEYKKRLTEESPLKVFTPSFWKSV